MNVPIWVDLAAVTLGAISGGIVAIRCRFDISGVLALAIVTGLGGGLLRDVLLQRGTPVALASPWLLPAAIATGALIFLFSQSLESLHGRLNGTVVVVDALFLGVYATVGTAKGIQAGLPAASCILLGVVTGIGGGLLRDVLVNETPEALRPGALATLAAIIGCTLQLVLVRGFDLSSGVGAGSIALIAGLRVVSVWKGWESPLATDLLAHARTRSRPFGRRPPSPPPPDEVETGREREEDPA
ncbi:MAG: TRIC cation channel family protein [Thermoleophilia bacterium]|nr:TRIC cation channel family protein [Thermoleophilia bacterium]